MRLGTKHVEIEPGVSPRQRGASWPVMDGSNLIGTVRRERHRQQGYQAVVTVCGQEIHVSGHRRKDVLSRLRRRVASL